MNDETRRTLQLLELKILLEIKRICEKYNIAYFLEGGTLLGAVRHKGFIPWDDDIDVGMRRGEYEKFLKVAESELGSEFFLQTSNTDPGYANSFAKIRLLGTEYKEIINEKLLKHYEIYVDIFPFDNIPDGKMKQMIYTASLSLVDGMCTHKVGYNLPKSKNKFRRIGQITCTILSHFVSKKFIINMREKILLAPNKHKSELIWNWPSKSRDSHYIDSFLTLSFEGFQFSVPWRYHEYLTCIYGNYMQLPPENERVCHSPYDPKFGKYAYVKRIDDIL